MTAVTTEGWSLICRIDRSFKHVWEMECPYSTDPSYGAVEC